MGSEIIQHSTDSTTDTIFNMVSSSSSDMFPEMMSFDETKSFMQKNSIQFRTCDTMDSLYLLTNDGLILEKETNNVICRSNKKFNQIGNDLSDQINQLTNLEKDSVDMKVEYCEDGTVIRLYNYKDTWYTATSKCLDARKSYWSSDKNFDEMFWETFRDSEFMGSLENGLDSLDKDYTYLFILFHTENRIVIRHNYNSLMYVKRIDNKTGKEDFTNTNVEQLPINHGEIHYPLDDYFVNTKRGLLFKFYKSDGSYETYQYDFSNYNSIKVIRGNVPLIRMRMLELLEDPESLEILKMVYNEYLLTFSMAQHSINNLYKEVHKLYIESHIKHHIQIYEANPLYKTLKQLHGQYKNRVVENPGYIITIDEVKSKVNSLNPNILSKLLGWV